MAGPQDTSEGNDGAHEALSVQVDLYRRMPAGRKLELVFDTYRTGQSLALAGIRMRNPEAAEEDLWRFWAQEHLGSELFESTYGKPGNE